MIKNIEDCLETLVGLRQHTFQFQLNSLDHTIMSSIARQAFRGTALTDRQYALMKDKLSTYADQFQSAGVDNFNDLLEQTRKPLREIDRSKYITLRDNKIVIRFPFKKTDILHINDVVANVDRNYYNHERGSHEHEFEYNEICVLHLLDRFINKQFTIDQELLDVYEKIKKINTHPKMHLSGIVDGKLVNINKKLMPYINDEVGEHNIIQLVDRRFRYGFDNVDFVGNDTLVERIATRKTSAYHSKPTQESTQDLLSALWDLNRFPLLVVLERDDAEEQLHTIANYYRDILPSEQQSVLFRLEETDAGFNQLVKDRKLNNWVDKDTKVVYISIDKLPKLLINNAWKPTACLSFNSNMNAFVESYILFNCDLTTFREETVSPFRRHWWQAAN